MTFMAGCSQHDSPTAAVAELPAPAHYSHETPEVGSISRSPLFMSHLNLKNRVDVLNLGNRLYLGDEVDRSLEVFGTPPKAYDVTDLPAGWKNTELRATGWETSSESFAAILKNDRVAFAIFSVEHAEDQLLNRIAQEYVSELGKSPSAVDGKVARYRFWDFQDHSLMATSVRTPRYGVVVTVAMGVKPIMDALRMNPSSAKEDANSADKLKANPLSPETK